MSPTPSPLTRADVLRPLLPTVPTFDLATEPWIDVCDPDGGRPRQVGLRDGLCQAHTLRLDEAIRGPLWRHATLRLLIALTYLIRANSPSHRWDDVASGGAPLPAEGVDAVLDRLSDRLWLHHPSVPFLQDPAVLAQMPYSKPTRAEQADPTLAISKVTDPFWTLLPDVPAKSNTAWFGRAESRDRPGPAGAAAALLVRHYFALPGNEAPNDAANRKPSKGGATGLTHNGRSFATITGPTLAATLTRNMLKDWVCRITPDTSTFFEDPNGAARNLDQSNPLWTYTASCAATVIVPVTDDIDDSGYRVVRTPMPQRPEIAKYVASFLDSNDPHGLRVKAKTAGQPYSHVQLSAAGSELDLIRVFYRDMVRVCALDRPSVLRRHTLAHYSAARMDTDVLVVDGAGSRTGPRVAHVSTFAPPSGALTVPRDDAEWFLGWANRIVGGKGAAAVRVGTAVLGVMTPRGGSLPPRTRTEVYERCREQMSWSVEDVLRDLLKTAIDPDAERFEQMPDVHQQTVYDSALAIFDQLTSPLADRPQAVPVLVAQRRTLRRGLTKLWSNR